MITSLDLTRLSALQPDFLTIGKYLAGGVPAAVHGFTEQVSRAFTARLAIDILTTEFRPSDPVVGKIYHKC
jgi:glutamate-1-semialdehyde aminotransferase